MSDVYTSGPLQGRPRRGPISLSECSRRVGDDGRPFVTREEHADRPLETRITLIRAATAAYAAAGDTATNEAQPVTAAWLDAHAPIIDQLPRRHGRTGLWVTLIFMGFAAFYFGGRIAGVIG